MFLKGDRDNLPHLTHSMSPADSLSGNGRPNGINESDWMT